MTIRVWLTLVQLQEAEARLKAEAERVAAANDKAEGLANQSLEYQQQARMASATAEVCLNV